MSRKIDGLARRLYTEIQDRCLAKFPENGAAKPWDSLREEYRFAWHEVAKEQLIAVGLAAAGAELAILKQRRSLAAFKANATRRRGRKGAQ